MFVFGKVLWLRCGGEMLICLSGLHGAGKSYFSFQSGIPQKQGFKVFNKKDVVRNLCIEEFRHKGINVVEKIITQLGRDFTDENERNEIIWKFCHKWYGGLMENDTYGITSRIINYVIEKSRMNNCNDIILDAIHNNKEWEIIHELDKNSALLMFMTPPNVRNERSTDIEFVNKQNAKRMGFWCSDPQLPPLPYMAVGFIDGSQTIEQIEKDFIKFVSEARVSIDKGCKNECIDGDFLDSKLQGLLSENEALTIQNAKLRYLAMQVQVNDFQNAGDDELVK